MLWPTYHVTYHICVNADDVWLRKLGQQQIGADQKSTLELKYQSCSTYSLFVFHGVL